jgi:hypothetical protein
VGTKALPKYDGTQAGDSVVLDVAESLWVFAVARVKLAVYSHIVPRNANNLVEPKRKNYSGPLEVGEGLTSIEIGDKVVVRRPQP